MKHEVGMNLTFVARQAGEGEPGYGSLEDFLDAVMEELLDLGFQEPSIGGSLSAMQVEISVEVESDSAEKAVVHGVSAIRSALHAAHVSTPGWDSYATSRVGASQSAPPELVLSRAH